METIQFKTNIKCLGCIAKVTSVLNEIAGADNWQVDIDNPAKILTVSANGLTEKAIRAAVEKAGFKAEKID
ncbi:heavy-metal-associated domain-containing protein [Puia sp. P3]|uniref:heavy-metal-associated domain-containing protein n=1 Tax=Puia sp. P3 TaxID=3423952 RepID=UPI003D667B6E